MLKSALFTHLERGGRPSAIPDASLVFRARSSGLPDTLAGRQELYEATLNALRPAIEQDIFLSRETVADAVLLLQYARPFLLLHNEDAAPPGGLAATVRRPAPAKPRPQPKYFWQPLLRSARARKGLTQVQVSKRIRVPQVTYGVWERGDFGPRGQTAERVFPLLQALLDLPDSAPTPHSPLVTGHCVRRRAKRRRYAS